MGNFARYIGTVHIPKHQKEKFSNQMLKILNYGGMMDLEEVNLFGHTLMLLKPVELFADEEVSFYYNYFEDNNWESAVYDTQKYRLYTNKIGSSEFCTVILAAYTLYEIYSGHRGLVLLNGEIIDPYDYVSWINHLLGTKFSLEMRRHLWELAELYALDDDGYYERFCFNELLSLIPQDKLEYAGGTEFADLCYITMGTETLTEKQVFPGSYPADVLKCKNAIRVYLEEEKETTKRKKIFELVCKKRRERENVLEPKVKEIAECSLFLPARVIVYLTAEICEENFWSIWDNLRKRVYHDEIMKSYADDSLEKQRADAWKEPVQGMRTRGLLYQDWDYHLFSAPDELKGKPKYHVSDDDRLFWWDGSDEVIISKKMDQWMKELAKRHRELIMKDQNEETEGYSRDFLKDFCATLEEINQTYQRILPFQSMFYEFTQNGYKKEYRAAVSLLRELAEENKEEGKAIEYLRGYWDLANRKVTFNQGRLNMKRYMSIMANRSLRMKYFGF